ncbi:hypothetical protein [Streptomyces sp. NPDC005303]|uniref:hypothetical protein n=1 Tax=Streptomyces sp. NPDC005303 TaxID=3155713 RepID=UPI0033A61378
MYRTHLRLRHKALTACAAALALLTAGCVKASAGEQTGGCRGDDHWSQRQQAAWLRSAVAFRDPTGRGGSPYQVAAVEIRAARTGDVRPLCEPVAVQVEFWSLTATATGTEMSSVMRYRLSADGSRTRSVDFPAGLPAARDSACTRVLVAAYVGAPLTQDQLPRRLTDLATVRTADVRFGTERIGAFRMLLPSDPTRCDTARPTASPSPSRSVTWDIHHP